MTFQYPTLTRILAEATPTLVNFQQLKPGDEDLLTSLEDLHETAGINVYDQEPLLGYVRDREVITATWVQPDGGMFSIAVRTGHKQQGLARKLLEDLIVYGKSQGWDCLMCFPVHEVILHLIQSLGFTKVENKNWFLSLEPVESYPPAISQLMTASGPSWKPRLTNNEVVDYIEENAREEIDREMVEELIGNAEAVLKIVPLSKLKPGPKDNNLPNASLEKRYAKLSPETMPPLVVEDDFTILDGHHRYRVAKKKKLKTLPVYILVDPGMDI